MKNLTILFLLFLGLMFVGCSDDEGATFEEKFAGEWTITFLGDLTGTLPLTVNDAPGGGSGTLPITIDGFTVNYDLTTNISENGGLTIDFNTPMNGTGVSSGTLKEDGTGDGTYTIDFINTDNSDTYEIAGDWTAAKN